MAVAIIRLRARIITVELSEFSGYRPQGRRNVFRMDNIGAFFGKYVSLLLNSGRGVPFCDTYTLV